MYHMAKAEYIRFSAVIRDFPRAYISHGNGLGVFLKFLPEVDYKTILVDPGSTITLGR